MTQSLSIRTRSPEETERMAARLGEKLEAPLIFLLNGGLGAGKTAFSKAFAKGAGSTDDTASPTYTIAATYDSPRGPIHHFDLYRLADPDELYETGFDDYLEDETAFLLVEWPEKAAPHTPAPDLTLALAPRPDGSREARLTASTPRASECLDRLAPSR